VLVAPSDFSLRKLHLSSRRPDGGGAARACRPFGQVCPVQICFSSLDCFLSRGAARICDGGARREMARVLLDRGGFGLVRLPLAVFHAEMAPGGDDQQSPRVHRDDQLWTLLAPQDPI